MKRISIFLIACLAAVGFTSCVQDLNTEPINPNVLQKFDQDRIYYKIYASLGTTGQQGPSGMGDIDGDEGYGCFYRCIFVHNEFPTDVGWWVWRDAGVPELNEMKFDDQNQFTLLLYNRTIYNVTLCNHFLDNTKDLTDAKTLRQRAEVTFFRCLNYYYLMDIFGNPPFTMTVQLDKPKQIEGGRPALYRWVVDELKAAEDYLDENTEVYRVNANAARLLLARLYLNAWVYKGLTQDDAEYKLDLDSAAMYAKKVMDNGKYKLTEHYAQMFMGDNDHNEGACEVIFAIPQDGDYIQSYGATSFLLSMTRAEGMWSAGSINKWECFRSSPTLVEAFCNNPTSINHTTIKADERQMPGLLKDDRALLCNYVVQGEDSVTYQTSMEGPAEYGEGNFKKCWAICKWTGSYSTGQVYGKHDAFVDTDVPLLRVAEAYLTYAEALWRKNNQDPEALSTINEMRGTRHADPLPSLDKKTLLDEWLREFYCEGHRRIDLIRFGEFCGEGATMTWEGHPLGKPGYYIVYPLPKADLVANDNLVQNEGY